MSRDTTAEGPDDDSTESDGLDRQLLSDLSINVVPIAIIAVFVLIFTVFSPSGGDSDPLLLFHGALVVGIVTVSAVAGWVISREDAPLEGSVASTSERNSERE